MDMNSLSMLYVVAAKGTKLPTVAASAVDERALTKLKLGKAEQFVFVFAQVRRSMTLVDTIVLLFSFLPSFLIHHFTSLLY